MEPTPLARRRIASIAQRAIIVLVLPQRRHAQLVQLVQLKAALRQPSQPQVYGLKPGTQPLLSALQALT